MSVKKGWHGFSEVNHVVYESDKVTVEQIIKWLRESGTYIRTISPATIEMEQQETKD